MILEPRRYVLRLSAMRTLILALAILNLLAAADAPPDRVERARRSLAAAEAELAKAKEAYDKDIAAGLSDSEIRIRSKELERMKATVKGAADMVAIVEATAAGQAQPIAGNPQSASTPSSIPDDLAEIRTKIAVQVNIIAAARIELQQHRTREAEIVTRLAKPWLRSLNLDPIIPTASPGADADAISAAVQAAADANDRLRDVRYCIETLADEPDIPLFMQRLHREWPRLRSIKAGLPEWPAWAPECGPDVTPVWRSPRYDRK